MAKRTFSLRSLLILKSVIAVWVFLFYTPHTAIASIAAFVIVVYFAAVILSRFKYLRRVLIAVSFLFFVFPWLGYGSGVMAIPFTDIICEHSYLLDGLFINGPVFGIVELPANLLSDNCFEMRYILFFNGRGTSRPFCTSMIWLCITVLLFIFTQLHLRTSRSTEQLAHCEPISNTDF